MEAHLQQDLSGADTRLAQLAADAAVRTAEVTVIFTTPEATLAALRVAASLGRACNASVRLIAQQPPTFAVAAEGAVPRSPVESASFRLRLAQEVEGTSMCSYACVGVRRTWRGRCCGDIDSS
jgi:hypothetical protein